MGFFKAYMDYVNASIASTIGSVEGKRLLELGNGHVDRDVGPEKTAKQYFTNRGADHVSVDLNGLDGALPLDLRKPALFAEWRGAFDVILNSGTSEHVEPRAAQYECFQIMHECLKVGGIAVHLVPDVHEHDRDGAWKEHCKNYYSQDFFRALASANNYELVSLTIINGLVCACLRKRDDRAFMASREEFLRLLAWRRSSGVVWARGRLVAVVRALGLEQWVKRLLRAIFSCKYRGFVSVFRRESDD